MKWNKYNIDLFEKQKLPPERKYMLLMTKSHNLGYPNPIYVGYMKYAAGCKDSPSFVIPGYEGEGEYLFDGCIYMINVIAWCDCLTAFEYPKEIDND
jgi:hypothetical protein